MEVEFVQTVDDHLAFNDYHQASQPWWRRHLMWITVWPFLLVLLGVFSDTMLADPARPPEQTTWQRVRFLAVGAIFVTLVVALITWRRRHLVARTVERFVTDPQNKKQFEGWRKCSISPEGVTLRQDEGSITMKWKAVLSIEYNDEYVFLYTSTHNAVVVPRRPFASDDAFREFIATAHAYRDGAQDDS